MPVSSRAIGLTSEDKIFVEEAVTYIDKFLSERYKHDGIPVVIHVRWIESNLSRWGGCNMLVVKRLIDIYQDPANYSDGGKPWEVEYSQDTRELGGSLTFRPPKDD